MWRQRVLQPLERIIDWLFTVGGGLFFLSSIGATWYFGVQYRFGVDHSGECWNSIVHCRLHTHVTGWDLDESAVSTVANSIYNNGGTRNASHSQ